MSVTNYSKWDKLELSDDDDYECHPNVDKASMTRWRQAEVHRKRRDRHDKIAALQMETDLNRRMVAALTELAQKQKDDPVNAASKERLLAFAKQALEWDEKIKHDVMVMAHKDRDPRWQPPTPDPFFMSRPSLEDLSKKINETIEQIASPSAAAMMLAGFIMAINHRQDQVDKEIKNEEKEINSKINTETIREGFSKTVIAKEEPLTSTAPSAATKKKTEIVTLNNPTITSDSIKATTATSAEPVARESASSGATETAGGQEVDEEEGEEERYITDPAAEEFSKITGMEDGFRYLGKHKHIVVQKYSDEILAQGFNLEMKGQKKEARQCVHQALVIQYCAALGKDGVSLFFARLSNPTHQARQLFMQDVSDTYKRIESRVKELKKQEKEKEEKEKAQGLARVAAALQPDGTFQLPILPDATAEDVKRAEVFATFPKEFQRAILTQDVDDINAVLSTWSKEESEKYLQAADSVGLITLQTEDGDE